MSFQLDFKETARRRLRKIARHSPQLAGDISRKIRWLAANAPAIRHEYMKGSDEASLHVGQYRVLYLIEWTTQTITIVDIDKHEEAYRRLRRR